MPPTRPQLQSTHLGPSWPADDLRLSSTLPRIHRWIILSFSRSGKLLGFPLAVFTAQWPRRSALFFRARPSPAACSRPASRRVVLSRVVPCPWADNASYLTARRYGAVTCTRGTYTESSFTIAQRYRNGKLRGSTRTARTVQRPRITALPGALYNHRHLRLAHYYNDFSQDRSVAPHR